MEQWNLNYGASNVTAVHHDDAQNSNFKVYLSHIVKSIFLTSQNVFVSGAKCISQFTEILFLVYH